MIIGLDAKWYHEGPPSGQIVVQNLFNKLIELNSKHKIILFLDKRYKNIKFPYSNSNLCLQYIWAKNNLISNLFILPIYAKKLNCDIIIFQNFSSIFGTFKKISYIHDVLFLSNPEFYTSVEKLYFLPLKYLSNRADLLITVSKTEKERLNKYGFKVNCEVIYHGVNSIFKPLDQWDRDFIQQLRDKYFLPNDFILFVGRFNVRKNLKNLLKAVKVTKNNLPLVIVGREDWRSQNIDRIIRELNLTNRVLSIGFLTGHELAAIFSLSKIFCFPSFAESFGLPPLESMASGVPIIVSNRTCLPEICKDAGNYINPDIPQEIADMIDILLTDRKLYAEKKQKGIILANKYTWELSALRLLNIIEGI